MDKPKCYSEPQVEKQGSWLGLGYLACWLNGICRGRRAGGTGAGAGSACATHSKGPLTNPPLSPRAAVLRKGGAYRPSSSAAGGEARDSAQSVFFPSLLGGVGLVVWSVSDGPTPELSLTGADDSAERAERAGWVREQQLQQGRGGQGCWEWGGGKGMLHWLCELGRWWRRPRAGRGGHIVRYPSPSRSTQI